MKPKPKPHKQKPVVYPPAPDHPIAQLRPGAPSAAANTVAVVVSTKAAREPAVGDIVEPTSGVDWMVPLLIAACVAFMLALVPQRLEWSGAIGWYLVRARIAFAVVGIGLFCGLMIPMLVHAMP